MYSLHTVNIVSWCLRKRGEGLTVAISKSSIVIGHSDEVIAAWRLPIGQFLSQQTVGEVQVSGETTMDNNQTNVSKIDYLKRLG